MLRTRRKSVTSVDVVLDSVLLRRLLVLLLVVVVVSRCVPRMWMYCTGGI